MVCLYTGSCGFPDIQFGIADKLLYLFVFCLIAHGFRIQNPGSKTDICNITISKSSHYSFSNYYLWISVLGSNFSIIGFYPLEHILSNHPETEIGYSSFSVILLILSTPISLIGLYRLLGLAYCLKTFHSPDPFRIPDSNNPFGIPDFGFRYSGSFGSVLHLKELALASWALISFRFSQSTIRRRSTPVRG